MADRGRPKKDKKDKKVREAIYFDPELHKWLKEKAEKQHSNVSVMVNAIVAKRKESEGE